MLTASATALRFRMRQVPPIADVTMPSFNAPHVFQAIIAQGVTLKQRVTVQTGCIVGTGVVLGPQVTVKQNARVSLTMVRAPTKKSFCHARVPRVVSPWPRRSLRMRWMATRTRLMRSRSQHSQARLLPQCAHTICAPLPRSRPLMDMPARACLVAQRRRTTRRLWGRTARATCGLRTQAARRRGSPSGVCSRGPLVAESLAPPLPPPPPSSYAIHRTRCPYRTPYICIYHYVP